MSVGKAGSSAEARVSTRRRWALRAHHGAAALSWSVLVLGLVINQAVEWIEHHKRPEVLLTSLGIFFPLLLLRLFLAIRLNRGRRGPQLLLFAGLAAWATGSLLVNAAKLEGSAHFPARGEWLFLVAYLGFAGYLILDVDLKVSRPLRSWLDLTVVMGSTACVASLLLVMPLQVVTELSGLSLLLALLYPLAYAVLALVVFTQALFSIRTDRRKSWMLGSAFVMLVCAESGFVLQVSARTYDFGNLSIALWGFAFSLLVAAASRPKQVVISVVPQGPGSWVLAAAGIAALAVLAIRPEDELTAYTVPPAVITMACIAVRLVVAVRDANRAGDALLLSMTDDLTMLPNRRALRRWLSEGLAEDRVMGLMLLDLDGFKEINDSLGHRAGDTVLTLVALRLEDAFGGRMRFARLGGDEFAILVATDDEIELLEIANEVLAELAKPVLVEEIEISPAASIGITVAQPDDNDGGDVLRRADVAMYQAKNATLGAALYDAELDEFSRSRLQLAEELRKALADDQIEVWYQPQFDAASLEVSGVEALVRWLHPVQGLTSPVVFLPAARRAGLMGRLSEVVASQALGAAAQHHEGGRSMRMAINCAPPELLGDRFLPTFFDLLEEQQIPANQVVLEVTEESVLVDPQRTGLVMRKLRENGVQVSIDDYGTGFSSLTYLRNLPVQELKIDRSLVRNVADDERSRMIVASTIQMAHALDMRVVAEGVENAADLECLRELGIDLLQGYHLARPMAPDRVWQFLAETTAEGP